MPKWLDRYASQQAKKAGLKPGSKRFNADKYTIIRRIEKKEKKK